MATSRHNRTPGGQPRQSREREDLLPTDVDQEFPPLATPAPQERSRRDELSPAGAMEGIRGSDEELTMEQLRRMVSALSVRVQQAESRQGTRSLRFSTGSRPSEGGSSPRGARPKLERPWTFEGKYTVFMNVLNWTKTVTWYLQQCHTDTEDWPGYARSYMDPRVQAWMDACFQDSPTWEELKEALVNRYMPVDHKIQLELKFESLRENRGLEQYVETFQVADSALLLAEVTISDEKKVLQFVRGLEKEDDRRFILERRPKNLKETYQTVVILRQAKTLAAESRTPRDKPRKFNRLEGSERQRAWKEGLCLECGSKDHRVADCPKLKGGKKDLKKFSRDSFNKGQKGHSQAATKGSKVPPKRHYKMLKGEGSGEEPQGEDSEEEAQETSGSEEDPSSEGEPGSGN